MRPAVGVFWMFPLGDDAGGYLGARGGPQFLFGNNKDTDLNTGAVNETSTSRVDGAIGPAFGGEYFFDTHFSLGAEVKIDFVFVGDEKRKINGTPPPGVDDNSGLIVSTGALLFARAFFF